METRKLGDNGPAVSAIGLGCMGMSEFYGPGDEAESLATMERAVDLGVTFFDTADMYGMGENEKLVGKFLKGNRHLVFLATKFGVVREPGTSNRGLDGSPDYLKAACNRSLQRLGIDTIDLYYQHRVDPTVPIEETVGAMAELVQEGKVRHLGLSEASSETIRRAHKVHPIAAVQTEYSLWTRDVEDDNLKTMRELGIALVAYSPLGRGFLTGAIQSPDDFAKDDFRRISPRFQGDNFQKNLDLVKQIQAWAEDKGCTPAQLALAWVMAQGDDIIPIPGTKRRTYLEQNAGAAEVKLTGEELKELDALAPKGVAAGLRYPEAAMGAVNR
ncbi:aldo/keto reductase [bacterium]|nr:aldo/keto reductase [bacterium]